MACVSTGRVSVGHGGVGLIGAGRLGAGRFAGGGTSGELGIVGWSTSSHSELSECSVVVVGIRL